MLVGLLLHLDFEQFSVTIPLYFFLAKDFKSWLNEHYILLMYVSGQVGWLIEQHALNAAIFPVLGLDTGSVYSDLEYNRRVILRHEFSMQHISCLYFGLAAADKPIDVDSIYLSIYNSVQVRVL